MFVGADIICPWFSNYINGNIICSPTELLESWFVGFDALRRTNILRYFTACRTMQPINICQRQIYHIGTADISPAQADFTRPRVGFHCKVADFAYVTPYKNDYRQALKSASQTLTYSLLLLTYYFSGSPRQTRICQLFRFNYKIKAGTSPALVKHIPFTLSSH